MTIERKVGMGIAGQPSGGATDVADVFSTYLYKGNGATRSINNGIDLAGEGGMTWVKRRTNGSYSHQILDTERSASGGYNALSSNTTGADNFTYGWGFNSNGFTINGGASTLNQASEDYASWTFRKKKKFFDVVTYTGNGVAGRTIPHGLDGPVGMIIIKSTNVAGNWLVNHKSVALADYLYLNTTASTASFDFWNNTEPTSTHFTVGSYGMNNANGDTFVAYLFADNSSEDADDQMIKCGSYTGDGNSAEINIGWEPQFVIVKRTSTSGNWYMADSMRGESTLSANSSNGTDGNPEIEYTSRGFRPKSNLDVSHTYIYMAIRAPMMVEPEAATDVYAAVNYTGDGTYNRNITGFTMTPDMLIASKYNNVDDHYLFDRMRGWVQGDLWTNASDAENVSGAGILQNPSVMDSIKITNTGTNYLNSNSTSYNINAWKRAKGFMDVVAYSGTGSARTQAHSLAVVPEMIWVKNRNAATDWAVYSAGTGNTHVLTLNDSGQPYDQANWNDTTPTSSVFSVGTPSAVNGSGNTYIAYLFATLDGISKVGSYTGNGSSQTINCGFSAGARFILIKRTNAAGSWCVWDSVRGIVAGNEPNIFLDTSADQNTTDSVDPHNSGFIVNQVSSPSWLATNINVSSATYIFYAIA